MFPRPVATCHQLNGKCTAIGPDLTGSWRNGLDYFLESVSDPNAVVGEAFQLNIVTRKNDAIVARTALNATAGTPTIRTQPETLNVPRADLTTRQVLEQSTMTPELTHTHTQRDTTPTPTHTHTQTHQQPHTHTPHNTHTQPNS